MGCTIHTPREPWWGGEVQKRDFMFRLGETFTTPDDWYLRIDADETLTSVPADARRRLSETQLDVAEVTIWEREASEQANSFVDTGDDYRSPFRCLFRALPGIRIEQAHYLVTVPDERRRRRVLNADRVVHKNEPAELLHDIGLEHRTRQRPLGRQRLKKEYYDTVLELDMEHLHQF